MINFLIENIAPIMFISMVLILLLGYPVSLSIGAIGIVYGILGIYLGLLNVEMAYALPPRIWGVMTNDTLLAIPFFTLMGLILERSGMAEDLLDTIGKLFGTLPGGLAFAVLGVGTLLAATTGVVAASVISMGLISLPIMLRYGYDRRLATGVITASGTLAQIVPPSLVLIVMADQLGRSVGDMYHGAFLPAMTLVGLYVIIVVVLVLFKPVSCPGLPAEALGYDEKDIRYGRKALLAICFASTLIAYLGVKYQVASSTKTDEFIVLVITYATIIAFLMTWTVNMFIPTLLPRLTYKTVMVMVPPLLLVFLVLGTIFLGVATPTEGGAMGACGAIIVAALRRRLSWALLKEAVNKTGRVCAFVMLIVICARVFSLTFYAVDGDVWVRTMLGEIPGGAIGFLIFANIVIFILAFFLDFFELAFIVIPLLVPAAVALGIDLVWFGVLIAVNLQASFMHPPFGLSLFFMRSVAPREDYIDKITGTMIKGVKLTEIYLGAIPFIAAQIVMIFILILFPQMVMVYKSGHQISGVDAATIEIIAPSSNW